MCWKCTVTLQQSAELQRSGKYILGYCYVAGEEVSIFCTCDIGNRSFLELFYLTLSSGMIANIRKYCDEDEFEDVTSSPETDAV